MSNKISCPYCNKEFTKRGLNAHINIVHLKTRPAPMQGKTSFIKGKSLNEFYGEERAKEIVKKISKSVSKSMTGKSLSEEHKQAVSKGRKKFIQENPHMSPYLLNHNSKGPSYPELYFNDLFDNEGIGLLPHYQVSIYQLDFACPEIMKYLEIDGEQHYKDPRILESDERRTNFLSKLGWSGMRIRWSIWQKMTLAEKIDVIDEIKKFLNSNV